VRRSACHTQLGRVCDGLPVEIQMFGGLCRHNGFQSRDTARRAASCTKYTHQTHLRGRSGEEAAFHWSEGKRRANKAAVLPSPTPDQSNVDCRYHHHHPFSPLQRYVASDVQLQKPIEVCPLGTTMPSRHTQAHGRWFVHGNMRSKRGPPMLPEFCVGMMPCSEVSDGQTSAKVG
jgi:hypothetical protein